MPFMKSTTGLALTACDIFKHKNPSWDDSIFIVPHTVSSFCLISWLSQRTEPGTAGRDLCCDLADNRLLLTALEAWPERRPALAKRI